MAKAKTAYVCSECGAHSVKWAGQCPDCGAWNAFVEEREQAVKIVFHVEQAAGFFVEAQL